MKIALLLPLLASSLALAEPQPLLGEVGHGQRLFSAHCASCHGADARGGSATASLRDPAFLAMRSDADLFSAISKGQGSQMPAYPRFPELDLWDVVAFLRQGEPRVADFFPDAAFFTAKRYGKLPVVTVYGHAEGGRGPERVAQDSVSLDKLSPKDKVGYLVFFELPRGDGHGSATYGLALHRDGSIARVASSAGLQKPAVDHDYLPFVGLGHKGSGPLPKPKGKRISPKLQAALGQAFDRAMAGVASADREEKDRHWADQK